MTVFISGGAKNGKSTTAQNISLMLREKFGGGLYYVATMIPSDDEDRARIRRHLSERDGLGFETVEIGRSLPSCLNDKNKNGVFMVDSLTALLLNEMYPDHSGSADPLASLRVADDIRKFSETAKNTVFVSDYIYSDAERYDEFTEEYRRSLAYVDRVAAEVSDTVLEICAGNIIVHKGERCI